VTRIGPASARTLLVLVPGFSGGAGGFTPGLQVWALDRRSQALEDTSVFERALAGRATPQQAFGFSLGWITDPAIRPRFEPPPARPPALHGRVGPPHPPR